MNNNLRHTVNGDPQNGWYCYQCDFFSRNVAEAAEHDGSKPGASVCKHLKEPFECAACRAASQTTYGLLAGRDLSK